MELPEFPPAGRPSRSWASSLPCYNVNSVPAQKQAAGLNTHNATEDGACQLLAPTPSSSCLFKPLPCLVIFLKVTCMETFSVLVTLAQSIAFNSSLFSGIYSTLRVFRCQIWTQLFKRSLLEMLKIMLVQGWQIGAPMTDFKKSPPNKKKMLPTFINWVFA